MHGRFRNDAVQRVRNGDDHGINGSGRNEGLPAVIQGGTGQFVLCPVQTFRTQIAYSGKLHAGNGTGIDAARMGTAHIADSDDSSTNHIHDDFRPP